MPHFMAYATRNPDFGMAWRSRALEPPRRYLKQILKRGVEEGLFPADLNYDLSLALLIGPIMYGYFLSPTMNKALPEGLPEQVVEAFLNAHAVTKPAREFAKETRRSKNSKR
jgi:hypothetical protein